MVYDRMLFENSMRHRFRFVPLEKRTLWNWRKFQVRHNRYVHSLMRLALMHGKRRSYNGSSSVRSKKAQLLTDQIWSMVRTGAVFSFMTVDGENASLNGEFVIFTLWKVQILLAMRMSSLFINYEDVKNSAREVIGYIDEIIESATVQTVESRNAVDCTNSCCWRVRHRTHLYDRTRLILSISC